MIRKVNKLNLRSNKQVPQYLVNLANPGPVIFIFVI